MLKSIQLELENLFNAVGQKPVGEFSVPPKAEMGDIAYPCFAEAKAEGKKPNEIAVNLAEKLNPKINPGGLISRAQAFGPYVNFFIDPAAVSKIILKEVDKKGERFGFDTQKKQEKVMVEYSQPNTHKEFHVGHIRNVCIGSSVVNLLRLNGYKTTSANYVGDIGAHVAKCLWYIKKNNFQPPETGRGRWLGTMYAEASALIEEKPDLKSEVAVVQQKLESGDQELVSFWKETKKWSMVGFEKIYKILGVEFDEWFFESEVEKPGKKIVQELLKSGIAKIGEGGAIIVDLASYGLDTFLILKSDGTSLYATKDLALAQLKFKKFSIDKSITVIDNRQRQYFSQLFKTLELSGWKKEMVFLGYEFVTLPEGAMSSRKGNVVLFDNLYAEVKTKLFAETKARHEAWPVQQVEETVCRLALAAIKFDMLKHPTDKAIVFDIKEATAFEGFSGPYLLYVVARINSLLEKAKNQKIKPGSHYELLISPEEKKLVLQLGLAEETIQKALAQYNPSVIARYTFELAQSFNDFYNKQRIVDATPKDLAAARLSLCLAVAQVLKNMLGVLAIETVEEM